MLRRSIAILALLALCAGSSLAAKAEDNKETVVSSIEDAWKDYMTRVEDFLGELQKNAADMLHKDDKKKNETDDSEAEATGRRLLVLGDGEQPDGEQPNDKKKNETQVDYIIEEIKNKKEENKAFLEDAHNKLKEFLKDGMDSLYSTFKKSGKLLKDATSTAGERFKELRTSMDGLTIQDMLDGSWKDYMPNNWDKFSLEDLAIFDINNYLPEGDFSSWPPTKPDGTPYDYEDLMTSYDDLISDFCTDEDYTPSEKVPTGCVGPSVTIALLPQVCALDEKAKELVCEPAKLVLTKLPLTCNLKYYSASTWKGKECKLSKEIGFTKSVTVGAKEYRVVLKEKHEKDQKDELDGLFKEVKVTKKDDTAATK